MGYSGDPAEEGEQDVYEEVCSAAAADDDGEGWDEECCYGEDDSALLFVSEIVTR